MQKNPEFEFIARVREHDKKLQPLGIHLNEVSELAKQFASKINLPLCGELIGLIHDIGKYSEKFQIYIREATGLFGESERLLAALKKGSVDHATSGAQWIHEDLKMPLLSQVLATCVACHHTGLYDYRGKENRTPFLNRIKKSPIETFYYEVRERCPSEVSRQLKSLISSNKIIEEFNLLLKNIGLAENGNLKLFKLHLGLVTRYLFSCLIDADRLSSANFEKPKVSTLRNTKNQTNWFSFQLKLEEHLLNFSSPSKVSQTNPRGSRSIDVLRKSISRSCFEASGREKGIFTLSVPTGGGKTLASLRFAIHHAYHHSVREKKPIERILYVIPYTSIIEQNAKVVRDIFGKENVLEHHSNIVIDKSQDLGNEDSWRNQILTENWDAPIVFTTSVQFLNSLFDGSKNNVRRMHQLANAVIIFDEIQALPIKTVHLFNNAINFLTQSCGSSVVLCTATQPRLDKVNEKLGAIRFGPKSKIISDDHQLFADLRRTQIRNHCKPSGLSVDEIVSLTLNQQRESGSTLVIVNTKASALTLYNELCKHTDAITYHLSTNMCSAHRTKILSDIKECLESTPPKPVICVSTQLIEAGVDIDFGSVIRYLAGLDSIAQAAGRCNRHGKNQTLAPVLIVNPAEENIEGLADIKKGQEITRTIIRNFAENPDAYDGDLISPKAMEAFYFYYFEERKNEMVYPIKVKDHPDVGVDTDLIDLLSSNDTYSQKEIPGLQQPLFHAFKTAGELFKVIDAPTEGIVVPYGEGKEIISELCSAFQSHDYSVKKQVQLLKRAQQYTVNVFPAVLKKLYQGGCIHEVQEDAGIYYLEEQYYHDAFGISKEETMKMSFLNI